MIVLSCSSYQSGADISNSRKCLNRKQIIYIVFIFFYLYILTRVVKHGTNHCLPTQKDAYYYTFRPIRHVTIIIFPLFVVGNATLSSDCYVDTTENSMFWNAISFICLLIQLRIFHTYYYQHVVLDLYVQDLLSHRWLIWLYKLMLLYNMTHEFFQDRKLATVFPSCTI